MFTPAMLLAASLAVPTSAHAAAPADTAPAATVAVVRRSRHRVTPAAEAGLSSTELLRAEQAVDEEIRRGAFPGAALAAGRHGRIVLEEGLGHAGFDPADEPVDPDWTLYDLASLSKVVGTTSAVMLLWEDGRLDLDAPVAAYLPEFTGDGKERVTIRQLLTHTSGLPDGADMGAPSADDALARALRVPLRRQPGASVEYSDVGFVVLFAAAERAAGEPLYRLLDRRLFGPLGMASTTYVPGEGCERCVSTARGAASFRGKVHDPTARQLGGIAGNAGLFATVHDLARFAAMLANGGELDGTRIFRERTVREFTRRQPGAGTRALGWDTPTGGDSGAAGSRISRSAFGHTGYTGTSVWIDPDRGTWVVLLANRTYDPRGANRIQALRRSVHDAVAAAADHGRYAVARDE
jgi:CubicO group peptidase (beta-lactamase class C family)